MKKSRILLNFVAFFWALTIVLWPTSSDRQNEDALRQPSMKEQLFRSALTDAQFGILGFRLYETKDGKRYWNLESRLAELYRDSNYTLMEDVAAEFFSLRSGNVVRTKGDRGKSQMVERLVELEGNVFILSERGYAFNLERVTYVGADHQLKSDSRVKMKGPNPDNPKLFLEGIGLLAKIDDEHYQVHKNVHGKKRLSNARWLHISSRKGEFFSAEEKAIFRGAVKSAIEDLEIDSDRLQVAIAEGKETLVAKGHVKVRSKGRVATAEKAALEVGTNQLVLEGQARVVDAKKDRIEGRKIVLYTDDDRVEVLGAKGNIDSDS